MTVTSCGIRIRRFNNQCQSPPLCTILSSLNPPPQNMCQYDQTSNSFSVYQGHFPKKHLLDKNLKTFLVSLIQATHPGHHSNLHFTAQLQYIRSQSSSRNIQIFLFISSLLLCRKSFHSTLFRNTSTLFWTFCTAPPPPDLRRNTHAGSVPLHTFFI
jgi:hypothetical protein